MAGEFTVAKAAKWVGENKLKAAGIASSTAGIVGAVALSSVDAVQKGNALSVLYPVTLLCVWGMEVRPVLQEIKNSDCKCQ
jgi:hypothetical protein